ELAEKLQVTVGVIGCNWGGTSASCWRSREAILAQEATRSYGEEYEKSELVHKPETEQIREYREYLAHQENWDKRAASVYEKEPMMAFDKVQELIGPCRYPGPMNCANFTRPAGLYDTMLRRVMPYTLRGFIYYQGESDDHRPQDYYALLTGMIRQWRQDWGDDRLPFLLVQLPMHRYQHDPDTKNWCIIRESQMRAFQMLRNTGIAVAIDCGQFHEIHPKNKKPVGERLALQALSGVYQLIPGKDAFGPIYRDFLYRDQGMELAFDYAQDGLVCRGDKISGFELAGADGVFVEAQVVFEGERIFLHSEEVREPVMARYLWTNYGEVTVFGANGLPMAPFRTHLF
ncbi:MAG: sialate O-acetylesterase, partial [Acetatifactor sp.]|nr:sialate O-acetylesterase [Acetatifactor sp.]